MRTAARFAAMIWHDPARDVTLTAFTNLEEDESADGTTSEEIWNRLAAAYDRAAPARRC